MINWNEFRGKVEIASGYLLDAYGDLFALKRFSFESCDEFRKRVLYMVDECIKIENWRIK